MDVISARRARNARVGRKPVTFDAPKVEEVETALGHLGQLTIVADTAGETVSQRRFVFDAPHEARTAIGATGGLGEGDGLLKVFEEEENNPYAMVGHQRTCTCTWNLIGVKS